MEQGDFVPISKNLTTQLGETDGNNYNKAEKKQSNTTETQNTKEMQSQERLIPSGPQGTAA